MAAAYMTETSCLRGPFHRSMIAKAAGQVKIGSKGVRILPHQIRTPRDERKEGGVQSS
jgi:hypothetical protein